MKNRMAEKLYHINNNKTIYKSHNANNVCYGKQHMRMSWHKNYNAQWLTNASVVLNITYECRNHIYFVIAVVVVIVVCAHV